MTDPDTKNARIKHALLSSSTMPMGTGGSLLGGLSGLLHGGASTHAHDADHHDDFEDEDDTTNPRSGHGNGCGCC